MFLLDTNVVSELRFQGRANRRVIAWAERIDAARLFISAVTIFELEKGALLLMKRDPVRAAGIFGWIRSSVLVSFGDRILSYDERVALRCAALHVPKTRPERDAMIAATALQHDLTVVTRNVRDFASMGVPLLNPWEADV